MIWPGNELLFTLLYAGICMFCAMLASHVLALPAANRPLVQVLAVALPIAVVSVALLRRGGIEPAVTLLTASAATIAIFVGGAIVLITPRPGNQPPSAQSPAASLVLPLALVLILSGFGTHLTVATCIGLGILGILGVDLAHGLAPNASCLASPSSARATSPVLSWLLCIIIAAIPLALLFVVTGLFLNSAHTPHFARVRDLAIVNLLCPAMLISLLRKSLRVAHDGSPADALSVSGSAIMVILGLLLPGVCILDYLIRRHTDELALMAGLPPLSWRLDAPILAVGGFALVAMRLDVLRPQRWVGIFLILLYAAYLLTGSVLRLV